MLCVWRHSHETLAGSPRAGAEVGAESAAPGAPHRDRAGLGGAQRNGTAGWGLEIGMGGRPWSRHGFGGKAIFWMQMAHFLHNMGGSLTRKALRTPPRIASKRVPAPGFPPSGTRRPKPFCPTGVPKHAVLFPLSRNFLNCPQMLLDHVFIQP